MQHACTSPKILAKRSQALNSQQQLSLSASLPCLPQIWPFCTACRLTDCMTSWSKLRDKVGNVGHSTQTYLELTMYTVSSKYWSFQIQIQTIFYPQGRHMVHCVLNATHARIISTLQPLHSHSAKDLSRTWLPFSLTQFFVRTTILRPPQTCKAININANNLIAVCWLYLAFWLFSNRINQKRSVV